MPKKSLSNASTSSMKWARRVFIDPGDTVGVVVGVDIPTLRGHFGVGDDAVHQQSPERVLVGRAREAAVDADHGDRRHGTTRSAVRYAAMAPMVA